VFVIGHRPRGFGLTISYSIAILVLQTVETVLWMMLFFKPTVETVGWEMFV
jgi:hypothetical protein